eukprot:GHVS01088735.1.p1 GENE.GHVS01088735.1~~GHVS01088735.1.p1  ORF type:complete len:1263 (+),score=240.35 GHVS01088735.1:211-3999(+)
MDMYQPLRATTTTTTSDNTIEEGQLASRTVPSEPTTGEEEVGGVKWEGGRSASRQSAGGRRKASSAGSTRRPSLWSCLSCSRGSTASNSSAEVELDEVVPDRCMYSLTARQLGEVVRAYVTRTKYEEVDMLKGMGGESGVLEGLNSNQTDGIGKETVEARQEAFGKNILPKRKPTPFLSLVLDAGSDFTLRILMLCGIVSIILAVTLGERPQIEWLEGFAIWLAVVVVILVTAGNDWMKEKQFRKLSAVKDDKECTVIRRSHKHKIPVADLVVGDLVYMETGDEMPGDCLVIQGLDLLVDESSLTGESDHVMKAAISECMEECVTKAEKVKAASEAKRHHVIKSPVVLSGTTLTGGVGSMLVVGVGDNSQVGQMFQKLAFDTEPTPLQKKLNAIARDIGKIGLICALLTFVVLLIEFWIMWALTPVENREDAAQISQDHVEFVVTAITILVVAIPEGLPLAVTISLAYSIGRMLKDQNYVRRLAACEIMGGANEICSDKTGTLTRNQMAVQAYWNGHQLMADVDISKGDCNRPNIPPHILDVLVDSISINSTGYLETESVAVPGVEGHASATIIKQVGSPTECALLQFVQELGFDYEQRRKEKFDFTKIVHQCAFSSSRKMMSTVVRVDGGLYRVFVKGAAERVLRLCTHRVDATGTIIRLEPVEIQRIESNVINQLAVQALRTICIAYKDFDPNAQPDWKEEIAGKTEYEYERGLTCLGIAGIRDPVRDEVPSAVRTCQTAGINVRMVTGDNIETAKQIALKCHIYKPEAGGVAMLGPEFYKLIGGVVCQVCKTEVCECPTNENAAKEKSKKVRVDVLGNQKAFDSIADKLQVLARSQPTDKYALVTGLISRGAVVSVTGDGTNDAPALKKADVGFAMGLTGKEVAKQAADIVLLDDNFESIVKAVKWGRNIYDNIRRFLQFQLTVNVVAVTATFICAVVLRETPLKAVQMLWVNMIMDSLASLALATEPPTDDLLLRKPHSRHDYLVSKTMFRNIIGQAIYQLSVVITLVFAADLFIPETSWSYVSPELRMENPEFCEFSDCSSDGTGTLMRSGRRFFPFSKDSDYKHQWAVDIGPSRHFTFVFNAFVWMQIFNMINARKTGNEINVFAGLFQNSMWLFVWCVIVIGQVLMVEFGSWALDCHLQGLSLVQWGICVAIGATTLLVPLVLRLFPLKLVPEAGQKEVNPLDEAPSIAMLSRGRISYDRIGYRIAGGLAMTSEQQHRLASHFEGEQTPPPTARYRRAQTMQAGGGAGSSPIISL